MKANFLFLFLVSIAVQAKPVLKTSLEEAWKNSEHILSAEITEREYDGLKEGQTLKKEELEIFWVSYRILKVLKGNLKPGQIIKIENKSNSCIPSEYLIVREKNNLFYFNKGIHNESNKRIKLLNWDENLKRSSKVNLFLDSQFLHYGWFISPSPWSQELELRK